MPLAVGATPGFFASAHSSSTSRLKLIGFSAALAVAAVAAFVFFVVLRR